MKRALREAGILLAVALVPAALAVMLHPQLSDRSRAGLETDAVRLVDVREWKTPVLWIDARSDTEFRADSIPGAVHLDPGQFEQQLGAVLSAWQPGMRVVVYCSAISCATSREVAARLRDAGMDDVYFLHGGWEAWTAARQP